MTITQRVIDQLYNEQRGDCAVCHRLFTHANPMQCHHAVYTRNVNFAKWLDMPENLVALCHECHTTLHGHLTGWKMRCKFYALKVRQGYDMDAWNESIPMIEHDIFTEEE